MYIQNWPARDYLENPFDTVTEIKAATGVDGIVRYCIETETFYRYEDTGSAYTADDVHVLTTGDGGNTRWLAVGGRYVYANSQLLGTTIPVSQGNFLS